MMRWRPAHRAHAIERVSMSLFFAEPIASKPWTKLLNSASADLQRQGFNAAIDEHEMIQAAGNSPVRQQPFGLQVNLGMVGSSANFPVSGRNFQVVTGTQIREEVHIHRNRFSYIAMNYERWTNFRARSFSLIGSYITTALQAVNIQGAQLEYWDRFVFEGPLNEVAYDELIRRGSSHVPSFPFDTDQLWHSHAGYFKPRSDGVRRLVNVNVDAIDVLETRPDAPPAEAPLLKRSLGFYSMAQDTLPPEPAITETPGALSTLDDLHATLKEVFADVITSEAADRISLLSKDPS